jgi:hypothetical protein
MNSGSANSNSPDGASENDAGVSLRALRKEHEALKSSSHARIQHLTHRYESLSAEKTRLEAELADARRMSAKGSRKTIKALTAAADTAWREVDALQMENAGLLTQVQEYCAYKHESEALLRQLQDALEATRQTAHSRMKYLTRENAMKLREQKHEADGLIREATFRMLDKSVECRALSQRIREVQGAAQAQISAMQNALAEARGLHGQFGVQAGILPHQMSILQTF